MLKNQFLSFFVVCMFGHLSAQDQGEKVNAASLLSGSYMRTTPVSYVATNVMADAIANYAPEALFDQSPKVWCSKQNAKFPFVFELELSENYIISELEFDNRCEAYAGISAREVMVEFATAVSNPKYTSIGNYTLKQGELQRLKIDASEARIIKITISSNYGNKEYTELAEFGAFGVPKVKDINTISIDGTWTSNWDNVTFNQTSTMFDGHYVWNNGKIKYGGINRNQITYTWDERKINRQGQTIMFMNESGTRLTGIWCYDGNWSNYGFWILNRKNGVPITPFEKAEEVLEEVKVVDEIVSELSKELIENKKIILYGINFNFGSSEITSDSRTILAQVGKVLSDNPQINVRIEGHTDAVGSESYNLKLSNERAEAVKSYLVKEHKLDGTKIEAVGKGEYSPIASNDNEMGKAANRRVEFHVVE